MVFITNNLRAHGLSGFHPRGIQYVANALVCVRGDQASLGVGVDLDVAFDEFLEHRGCAREFSALELLLHRLAVEHETLRVCFPDVVDVPGELPPEFGVEVQAHLFDRFVDAFFDFIFEHVPIHALHWTGKHERVDTLVFFKQLVEAAFVHVNAEIDEKNSIVVLESLKDRFGFGIRVIIHEDDLVRELFLNALEIEFQNGVQCFDMARLRSRYDDGSDPHYILYVPKP
jgi:hypothetical protein